MNTKIKVMILCSLALLFLNLFSEEYRFHHYNPEKQSFEESARSRVLIIETSILGFYSVNHGYTMNELAHQDEGLILTHVFRAGQDIYAACIPDPQNKSSYFAIAKLDFQNMKFKIQAEWQERYFFTPVHLTSKEFIVFVLLKDYSKADLESVTYNAVTSGLPDLYLLKNFQFPHRYYGKYPSLEFGGLLFIKRNGEIKRHRYKGANVGVPNRWVYNPASADITFYFDEKRSNLVFDLSMKQWTLLGRTTDQFE